MSEKNHLDAADRRILAALTQNGRINNTTLSEVVNLSATACARRVKRLEDDGIIAGYGAKLARKPLGLSLCATIAVTMDKHTPERFADFEAAAITLPEITQMSVVAGRAEDYLLQVVVRDMDHFEQFLLGKLNRIPGVQNVHSSFELRRVIDREPTP